MRRIFPFFIAFLACFITGTLLAQTPGGINYQGVARDQFLVGLNNDSITFKFNIREKTTQGAILYSETRGTRTDSFGVFNVVIGAAGAIEQSGSIKQVPWNDTTKKFLEIELNIHDPNSPGFLNMGTTQLLSVPFSFYSDVSDSANYSKGSGQYFFSATQNPLTSQPIPAGNGYNYVIKFPEVLYNEGNGYSPITSEFTAPANGYYEFGVTIHEWIIAYTPSSNSILSLDFAFIKNGKAVKMLENHVLQFNASGTTPNAKLNNIDRKITLKLIAGDKVSVRVANGSPMPTFISLGLTPAELTWFNANYEMSSYFEFSGRKIK